MVSRHPALLRGKLAAPQRLNKSTNQRFNVPPELLRFPNQYRNTQAGRQVIEFYFGIIPNKNSR